MIFDKHANLKYKSGNRHFCRRILCEYGYPDVQAFMATYHKMEEVVEKYNHDLAEWEQQIKKNQKPAEKGQRGLSERERVLK